MGERFSFGLERRRLGRDEEGGSGREGSAGEGGGGSEAEGGRHNQPPPSSSRPVEPQPRPAIEARAARLEAEPLKHPPGAFAGLVGRRHWRCADGQASSSPPPDRSRTKKLLLSPKSDKAAARALCKGAQSGQYRSRTAYLPATAAMHSTAMIANLFIGAKGGGCECWASSGAGSAGFGVRARWGGGKEAAFRCCVWGRCVYPSCVAVV